MLFYALFPLILLTFGHIVPFNLPSTFLRFVSILPTTGECSAGEAQRAAEEEICKLIPTRGSHSGD